MEWVTDKLEILLDYICLWFDDWIYRAVGGLYDIFISFTKLNIIDSFNGIETIIDRVMLLLGLLMLFKLAFSFLSFLINPDDLTSQDKGAGKIFTSVVIVLILLVVVKPGFEFLREVETAIVDGGFIQRLILGQDINGNVTDIRNDNDQTVSVGQSMAYSSYIQFFTDSSGVSCASNEAGEACDELKMEVAYTVLGDGILGNYRDLMEDSGIKYSKFFSSFAGIFLIIILFSFIIDVGIRAFKLVLYEMIAPIAIISYIEPKTKDVLWKWLRATLTTFADLFLRIAIMFLAVILVSGISNILNQDAFKDFNGLSKGISYFLLIIAIFSFAKMLPKLIADLFGINMGDSSINPLKKSGIVGGTIGGLIGAGAGGIIGGVLGGANGQGARGKILGAIEGTIGGTARGARSGISSRNLSDLGKKTVAGVKAQNQAQIDRLQNGNWLKRKANVIGGAFNHNVAEIAKGNSSALDNIKKVKDITKEKAGKNLAQKIGFSNASSYAAHKSGFNANIVREAIKNGEISRENYKSIMGKDAPTSNIPQPQKSFIDKDGNTIINPNYKEEMEKWQQQVDSTPIKVDSYIAAELDQQLAMENLKYEKEYEKLLSDQQNKIIEDELKSNPTGEISTLISQADKSLTSVGESGIMDDLKDSGNIKDIEKSLKSRDQELQNNRFYNGK